MLRSLPLRPCLIGLMMLLFLSVLPAHAAVPPEFSDELVLNIVGPTALAFLPDGRLLITQKSGTVRVYKNGALVAAPALDISAVVCAQSERGLLGVAVHPRFPATPYIYLYYTHRHPQNGCSTPGNAADAFTAAPFNRVSRFTMNNDTLDPASEVVLIDKMPSVAGNHNGGDVQFGKDGLLYISVGDSGCFYANMSRCAGDNPAAREEFTLLGKILRIADDGSIPNGNPYKATGDRCNTTARTAAGRRCQETFAWGLRNPFRIAFDPNAAGTRFYINDVGQGVWEEIDEGAAGADYGWNVREGHCANGSTSNCGSPPAGMTNPIFDYQHTSGSVTCSSDAIRGNSITGGAFVPNGVWPAAYDGDYFFGEYVCGKIFRLDVQGSSFTPQTFATGLGGQSAVHLTFGTTNSKTGLYYTSAPVGNEGQVRRIVYTGTSNRAPQARVVATPTSGPLPLDVAFDGSGSSDADGDALTYAWDFGDGQSAAASSNAKIIHRYTQKGSFTATLTLRDADGVTSTATVVISAGNTAPVVTIDNPTPATRFAVGQTITLRGTATDAEDGVLPGSALRWTVTLHHNDHTHPFLPATAGVTATITAPPPEDLLATEGSYLEVILAATDSQNVTTVVTRELRPALVNVTFDTDPAGLEVEVNGVRLPTPQTVVSWEGYQLNVVAPPQRDAEGRWLYPRGWSNGGSATQTIVTPATGASYRALFEPGYANVLPIVIRQN